MHVVHKHKFEIEVGRKDLAHQVHAVLGNLMDTDFYPKLSEIFDRYSNKDEIISFENIQLDLKILPEVNWQESLVKEMLVQVEVFLQNHLKQDSSQTTQKRESLPVNNTLSEYGEMIMLTYLLTGNLPVNSIGNNLRSIEEVIVINEIWIQQLLALVENDNNAWKRLLLNLSESFLVRILVYFQDKEKTLSAALSALMPVWKHWTNNNSRLQYIMPLFINLFQPTEDNVEHKAKQFFNFLQTYFSTLFHRKENNGEEILQSEKEKVKHQMDTTSYKILHHTLQLWYTYFEQPMEMNDIHEKSLSEYKDLPNINQPENTLAVKTKTRQEYFIENAGLVLLHPFILQLFKKAGYLQEDVQIKIEHQTEAILLLQYAIQGQVDFEEPGLLLNKILCGLDISGIINTNEKLTEEHKVMVNDLITAVISHWKILGNTSVEGFRNSFLKRKGKLVITGEGYELQVESLAYDILLDHLPWGISMIKLPWMINPLHVIWQP